MNLKNTTVKKTENENDQNEKEFGVLGANY